MKQFFLFLVLYFCSLEDTQIGEGGAGPLLSLERCHQQEPEPPGAQAGSPLPASARLPAPGFWQDECPVLHLPAGNLFTG